jgi:hypothetical protein
MAKTYNDDEEQFGGFGREAVEKAAKRPTYASTQGQVGERERREAEVAGPLKAPKKRIVTKEQMKKEGFDNLRDYLNFKQGKERRKAAPTKTASVPRKPSRGTQDEGAAGEAEARAAQEAKIAKAREMRKQTDPGDVPASARMSEYSPFKKGGSVKSSAPKMGKVKTAKPSMGGASKRADGIAMRGKTRGKMV